MTDNAALLRNLVLDARAETDLDAVSRGHLARAVAHESRRRHWTRRRTPRVPEPTVDGDL